MTKTGALAFVLVVGCTRTPVETPVAWLPLSEGQVQVDLPCAARPQERDSAGLEVPGWHERPTHNVLWWCDAPVPVAVARFDFARSPIDGSGLDPVLGLYVPFLLAHLGSPEGHTSVRVLADSSEEVGDEPGRAYVAELLTSSGELEAGRWVRVRGFAHERSVWVVLAVARPGQRFDPLVDHVMTSLTLRAARASPELVRAEVAEDAVRVAAQLEPEPARVVPKPLRGSPESPPDEAALRQEATDELLRLRTLERSYFAERDTFTDDLRVVADALDTPGRCPDGSHSPLPLPSNPRHFLGCHFTYSIELVGSGQRGRFEAYARRVDGSGFKLDADGFIEPLAGPGR